MSQTRRWPNQTFVRLNHKAHKANWKKMIKSKGTTREFDPNVLSMCSHVKPLGTHKYPLNKLCLGISAISYVELCGFVMDFD
jgi:hypothetical protein